MAYLLRKNNDDHISTPLSQSRSSDNVLIRFQARVQLRKCNKNFNQRLQDRRVKSMTRDKKIFRLNEQNEPYAFLATCNIESFPLIMGRWTIDTNKGSLPYQISGFSQHG